MATEAQITQILVDRLKGNGAWNGNGLLVFLASTSRKDPERAWMEPLKDLAEKVVYAAEDGEPFPALTDDELAQVDELIAYSNDFHSAIAANDPDYTPYLVDEDAPVEPAPTPE